MKFSKLLFWILFFVIVEICFSSNAYAYPDYLKIYAADPQAKPDWKNSCATCHENQGGGGPRNAFGQAFQEAGLKITPELRNKFPEKFQFLTDREPAVTFIDNSSTEVVIEINGRKWRIDTQKRTVIAENNIENIENIPKKTENPPPSLIASNEKKFKPMDDRFISLPTGRAIKRNSLYANFSHRFSFNEDRTIGGLFGLDGFSSSSFGLMYGITNRIHFGFNRSPSIIGRAIELFGGVTLFDELKGNPLTTEIRIGVEGSKNFTRNFATSISGTVSRSITSRAQIAVTPTISFNNRPLLSANPVPELPGETTFALGVGAAIKIRPSIAIIFEANQRLIGRLGTHRPAFGFGIEKVTSDGKHAFALTFNNSPGFTTAQRSGTRATLFGVENPQDDTFRGLSIGFNISRRLF